MEEWLNSYYAELDPVKRQQILEENSRDTQSGEGQLRHQLWTARYGDRKSTRLNSSHGAKSRMPSSA